ncbi:MAG: hypothetical protein GW748_00880 [Alphaproteobacteria bacterium]|nr:hypothetical protein [Alphaproteobacteria bacterium]NCQ66288.1 hypothetical protein [Alphaproteobacteria bacterium]NCT06774.1 hypothetical protein [Alphaproteobacteria bacterium]
MAAPLGTATKFFKPFSKGLKTLGRGAENSLRNVPIFDVRNSAPVFDILTQTTSGFKVTQHGFLRKIEREVKSCDILDALKNPLKIGNIKIDNLGRASQRYIGFGAEVAINPYTKKILSQIKSVEKN